MSYETLAASVDNLAAINTQLANDVVATQVASNAAASLATSKAAEAAASANAASVSETNTSAALGTKVSITDLADPTKGASGVGLPSPSGSVSTVRTSLESIDKEYKRDAYSILAGAIQNGPLIVDASRYLRITGNRSDASYNNIALQTILTNLPFGAVIEFPARGLAYFEGGLIVSSAGVCIRGHNSSAAYDQFTMQFTDTTKPAFTIKHSGFYCKNLLLSGDIAGRAMNDTQDIFDFDVTLNNGHCDARIDNVGFIYARAAISITKSSGRNIAVRNCNFSNSQYAFALEYDTTPNDQRMFEFYGNRFHTMGRLGSTTDSIFYIKPTANALSLIASGGTVDDSVRVMRGFAGMSSITGILSSRAAGVFADIDSTGFTLAGYRQFDIKSCGLMNISTTTHTFSAIKSTGVMALYINGFTSGGSGGHGLEIRSSYADIRATTIHNASTGATGVYSGFYIAPEATNVTFDGCSYKQGREVAAAGTSPKFAVENLGAGTMFQDRLSIDNLTSANAYYIDPTKTSRGPDPVVPGVLQRISWGSAAPTTGTWTLGDFVENVSSSGSNKGWRCTVGGSPGTWISV